MNTVARVLASVTAVIGAICRGISAAHTNPVIKSNTISDGCRRAAGHLSVEAPVFVDALMRHIYITGNFKKEKTHGTHDYG